MALAVVGFAGPAAASDPVSKAPAGIDRPTPSSSQTQACLATAAFMDARGYLEDRILTRTEWTAYVAFGPRLVPPTESLEMSFPIHFRAKELSGEAAEQPIGCAVGLGASRCFAKRAEHRPRPD